jgi:hypothetical protein
MQTPPVGFWHIDAGQILTWAVVGVVWLISRGMDWRGMKDRMGWMEEWRASHMKAAEARDRLINDLGNSNVKLTTLITESVVPRLNRIEDRRNYR